MKTKLFSFFALTSFFILWTLTSIAQGIEITSNAFVQAVGNATIEITDGNFTNNGTYMMGTENLIFSGSTLGSISGSSNNDFYHLTVNNSNGVTHTSSGYVAVNNLLIFSNGLFNTGSNFLIINDNATYSGASITTYINGNCRKVGNDVFVFPIGNNGKYAPIAITSPSVITDHFTATYFKTNPNLLYDITLKELSIDHVSKLEYWTLDRTNGTSNVNVTLYWDTASAVNNLTDLRVVRWDGNLWVDEGNSAISGSISLGTITSEIVASFSPFTFGSSTLNNPLPVELIAFSAECFNGTTQLKWTTASEINCDYYQVEKMDEENNFTTIGRVFGNGNTNQFSNYQFEDGNSSQLSYYRLKQVDYNGESHTYNDKIAFSNCDEVNFNMDLFGNINEVTIVVNSFIEECVIKIYDINGSVLLATVKSLNYGANKFNFANSNLAAGMYLFNIQIGQEIKSTKLIVM